MGGSGSLRPESGDVNDDGKVDISDAGYLLQFLFTGGPNPKAPFPDWGINPHRNSRTFPAGIYRI